VFRVEEMLALQVEVNRGISGQVSADKRMEIVGTKKEIFAALVYEQIVLAVKT
jgi:hypothetical protein